MPSNYSKSTNRRDLPAKVADLWPDYLRSGYFDEAGNLRREFVRRSSIDELAHSMAQGGLTNTQVRRFFQHCRAIESQIKSGQATWDSLAARFKKIDFVAEAAVNRTRDPIPTLFYDFLKANVAVVENKKDFIDGFLPHFEALVGFLTAHIKK